MDKYEHIIELGKDLPLIDIQYKSEENLIKGCQSRVWLHADMKDKKNYFHSR
jgi:cysteine desulfuration protein SufE